MHFDGSKMRLGLGADIVLSSPKGDRLCYALQIHFAASKNVTEYEPLVHGLRLAMELGIRRILYRFLVQKLSGSFEGSEFLHVPRAENKAADTLAKIASSRQAIPSGVSLEHLRKPSVKPSPDSESIHEQGIDILLDIHQGECGHHTASRSLVAKAFRHGFYWPTALQDAESLVLECEGCQRFSKRSHQPASALRTIPIARPFAVSGLDMGALKQYCSVSGIRLDLASVAHPQSNG
ncbi:uncharacterized protein [Aegilops tauschii subsp. strangulata]|uniref:uncharacterized protein n=1 Tax=Aegilops tauschii subsp. strangulata TaxID=200361 RepID=UPI003CC8C49D